MRNHCVAMNRHKPASISRCVSIHKGVGGQVIFPRSLPASDQCGGQTSLQPDNATDGKSADSTTRTCTGSLLLQIVQGSKVKLTVSSACSGLACSGSGVGGSGGLGASSLVFFAMISSRVSAYFWSLASIIKIMGTATARLIPANKSPRRQFMAARLPEAIEGESPATLPRCCSSPSPGPSKGSCTVGRPSARSSRVKPIDPSSSRG